MAEGVPVAVAVAAKVEGPVGVVEPVHQRVVPRASVDVGDDASVVLDDVEDDAVELGQRPP